MLWCLAVVSLCTTTGTAAFEELGMWDVEDWDVEEEDAFSRARASDASDDVVVRLLDFFLGFEDDDFVAVFSPESCLRFFGMLGGAPPWMDEKMSSNSLMLH